MATKSEGVRIGDVVRWECDDSTRRFCRDVLTVLDGEDVSLGELCKLNADGKAVACTAAANEVQTITFDAAMTAGELAITVFAPDGFPLVVSVPWTSDWAGTMAAWNTAMTAAATVWYGAASAGAVMTGTASEQVLTFSGDGFAGQTIPRLAVADISGTTGPTIATIAQTTVGHAAGGDAEMIALEAAAPSGADGEALFLTRGPAIVDLDQLTIVTGGDAAAVVALKTKDILALSEPALQETMP